MYLYIRTLARILVCLLAWIWEKPGYLAHVSGATAF